MSCKYISDGKLNMTDLRHDIASLVDPLSMSIDFIDSEKRDKAIFLQKEVLKNIKNIIEELKNHSGDTEIVKS